MLIDLTISKTGFFVCALDLQILNIFMLFNDPGYVYETKKRSEKSQIKLSIPGKEPVFSILLTS